MAAGKHSHKLREYSRRADALLAKERERHGPLSPPPPPINPEHHDLRRQIAELWRAYLDAIENPEGTDQMKSLEERMDESPELAIVGAKLIALKREEHALLTKNGVDSTPYEAYQLE